MARTLTTKDASALINAIAHEALGTSQAVQAINSSDFVSVGEMILKTGVSNTLNALGLVIGRTIIGVRPYQAKFALFRTISNGAYANRFRKISYYTKDATPTGADNTDLYTNFADGYDNGTNSGQSVANMWEQKPRIPLSCYFGGSSEWQYPEQIFEHQLKVAFRDENEFINFFNGVLTECANDIESEREAFSRLTLLNYMAGLYDLSTYGTGAINMTSAFNSKFGTSYTTAQLLSTYLTEFSEFFAAKIRTLSDEMTNRDIKYHAYPQISGHYLARHTPKDRQRLLMIADFWHNVESRVFPEVFRTDGLKPEQMETVLYWQNVNDPYAIKVTPAIPDLNSSSSTYKEQKAGAQVSLTKVLGVMYDEDALLVDMQLDDVYSTPVEARKRYRNLWYTFRKNAINDFTEKGILLYMAD